jgi:hypothetical protein
MTDNEKLQQFMEKILSDFGGAGGWCIRTHRDKLGLYKAMYDFGKPIASSTSQTIDNEKLQQFMGKILSDFGGAGGCVLVYIGDKLGLYKAMSDFGKPITSQELANLTATSERYIREWLANQAADGYLTYDASSKRYTLPLEHAQALVNENSPVYVAGGFQIMMSYYRDEPKILSIQDRQGYCLGGT